MTAGGSVAWTGGGGEDEDKKDGSYTLANSFHTIDIGYNYSHLEEKSKMTAAIPVSPAIDRSASVGVEGSTIINNNNNYPPKNNELAGATEENHNHNNDNHNHSYNNAKPTPVTKTTFPGRTRVWCGGKLITSAWTSWLWLTFLVIVAPVIVFFVFVFPEFINSMSILTLIPIFVLLPLSLAASLVTAWTDPGILPRNINPTATLRLYGATDYGNDQLISRLVFHEQNPDFLMGKEMLINGHRVFLKYCSTCQIFRPPRCSHCSYCDNCVEEFDHHCPWVSNCVGRRNYRYFIHFLLFTDLLCLYGAGLMMGYLYLITKGDLFGGWQSGRAFAAAVGIAAYTGMMALPLTGILLYHLFIIGKHVTTNEQIKLNRAAAAGAAASSSTSSTNVTQQDSSSCPRNYLHTFCLPRPTPAVSWRSYKSGKSIRS